MPGLSGKRLTGGAKPKIFGKRSRLGGAFTQRLEAKAVGMPAPSKPSDEAPGHQAPGHPAPGPETQRSEVPRHEAARSQSPARQAASLRPRVDASQVVASESAKLDALMGEWVKFHREACETQIRMMQDFVSAQCAMLKGIGTDGASGVTSAGWKLEKAPSRPVREPTGDSDISEPSSHKNLEQGPDAGDPASAQREHDSMKEPLRAAASGAADALDARQDAPVLLVGGRAGRVAMAEAEDVTLMDPPKLAPSPAEKVEAAVKWSDNFTDDQVLEWWKRTSGLHTVEKWVSNYKKHPAGWGALLMIHGIPEVTGRLRSKVENYSIYSALFLSVSMALFADPPSAVAKQCEDFGGAKRWECEIQRRIYFYCLGGGIAAHMLSILLGMAFVNVLNEAARDSDVIRMFARGKGFVATVKCQRAFTAGCIADFVGLLVAAKMSVGWEAVPVAVLLTCLVLRPYRQTSRLLHTSASIIGYWREELGGKPDADDPFDLDIPVGCLRRRTGDYVKLQQGELPPDSGHVSAAERSKPSPRPATTIKHAVIRAAF